MKLARVSFLLFGIFSLTYIIVYFYGISLSSKVIHQANNILKRYPTNSKFEALDASFNFKHIDKSKFNKIYIHFWATWCGPCERELPDLLEFAKKNPGFEFHIVSVNDEKANIMKFFKSKDLLKYSNVKNIYFSRDNTNSSQTFFGTYKLPETFIFSQDLLFISKLLGVQKWSYK